MYLLCVRTATSCKNFINFIFLANYTPSFTAWKCETAHLQLSSMSLHQIHMQWLFSLTLQYVSTLNKLKRRLHLQLYIIVRNEMKKLLIFLSGKLHFCMHISCTWFFHPGWNFFWRLHEILPPSENPNPVVLPRAEVSRLGEITTQLKISDISDFSLKAENNSIYSMSPFVCSSTQYHDCYLHVFLVSAVTLLNIKNARKHFEMLEKMDQEALAR